MRSYSVELVLGRTPSSSQQHQQQQSMRLDDADVDADASASDGGALSNPENHTFGMPVVGGAGSALPRRAGMRARTLESTTRRSPVSFVTNANGSSSNGAASAASAAAAAAAARARSTSSSASSSAASQRALALARARAGLQHARSFASEQGGSPPSILTREAARSTTQVQQSTPSVGMPIPQSQSQSQQPQQDVSTAAASLVTMPPTIAGETTDSGGRTPRSLGGMEHYAPPHARGAVMPR